MLFRQTVRQKSTRRYYHLGWKLLEKLGLYDGTWIKPVMTSSALTLDSSPPAFRVEQIGMAINKHNALCSDLAQHKSEHKIKTAVFEERR